MKKTALAALAGLLYTLAFPTFNLWPLIGVFAVPLLFLIDDAVPLEAFLYGLIAGIVAWGGNIYWVAYVMHIYGYLNLALSALILLIFIAYLALYFGLFAWLAGRVLKNRYAFAVIPGIWILLELIRTYAFTGFPWSLAGYALYPVTPLIQNAEWGGVYLLSGLILMANTALYKAVKRDFKPLLATVVVIALCVTWGEWRMRNYTMEGKTLKVGVCQANIPQDQKWLEQMVYPTIDIYARLTRKALGQGAEIVAWPETACNFYLFLQWMPTARVIGLTREEKAEFLIGSPAYENDQYFNRVYLIKEGLIKGYYDKTHLVPFGEYVPLPWLFKPLFGKLVQEVSDFSKARDLSPVEDIGALVCFEIVFPDLSRKLCRKGASYLVNASNDAWFKTWSTPEQHLKMAAFRAIENRRYLIMPVNHGISAIIDPMGRIVKSIGLLQEDVIVADIRKLSYQTFYTRFGPIIAWLWAIAGLTLLAMSWRKP